MTKKTCSFVSKFLLLIFAFTFSACTTPAKPNFSNDFFSTDFPENFKIEKNDFGTVLAFDNTSESIFIINYENTDYQTSTKNCKKTGKNFFSKIQDESDAEENYSEFSIKRNKKLNDNKNNLISLGYYCKNHKIIYISFIYTNTSKIKDAPFIQVINRINVK